MQYRQWEPFDHPWRAVSRFVPPCAITDWPKAGKSLKYGWPLAETKAASLARNRLHRAWHAAQGSPWVSGIDVRGLFQGLSYTLLTCHSPDGSLKCPVIFSRKGGKTMPALFTLLDCVPCVPSLDSKHLFFTPRVVARMRQVREKATLNMTFRFLARQPGWTSCPTWRCALHGHSKVAAQLEFRRGFEMICEMKTEVLGKFGQAAIAGLGEHGSDRAKRVADRTCAAILLANATSCRIGAFPTGTIMRRLPLLSKRAIPAGSHKNPVNSVV